MVKSYNKKKAGYDYPRCTTYEYYIVCIMYYYYNLYDTCIKFTTHKFEQNIPIARQINKSIVVAVQL